MFVGDLVHFRAALSNGVSHDLILSPSTATTPATSRRNSAANTPDNRSIASNDDNKKKSKTTKHHWWSKTRTGAPWPSRPVVKPAGMKMPMNVL